METRIVSAVWMLHGGEKIVKTKPKYAFKGGSVLLLALLTERDLLVLPRRTVLASFGESTLKIHTRRGQTHFSNSYPKAIKFYCYFYFQLCFKSS